MSSSRKCLEAEKALNPRVFGNEVIQPPMYDRWKVMLPVLALFTMAAFLVYQYNVNLRLATTGAVLAGFS